MLPQHERWLEDFLMHLQARNRSPHTVLNYQRDIEEFIKWFEQAYPGESINLSNVQVISSYSQYLSDGRMGALAPLSLGDRESLMLTKAKLKPQWPWWRKLWTQAKRWLRPTSPISRPDIDVTPPRRFLPRSIKIFRHPLKANSRRRHLSAIKSFFEFHKQLNEDFNRLFPTNPVKPTIHGIKLKDHDIHHTIHLPPGDWERLDETIYRPQERLALYLLYYAGLRLAEVANLKLHNFREHGRVLSVIRKGGVLHEFVPEKTEEIFHLLDLHLKKNPPPGEYVFFNRQGGPIEARVLSRQIKMMIKKASCQTLGLTPHSFRKACATRLYQRDRNLLQVRDYLNHSDAKVTQTYIDPSAY